MIMPKHHKKDYDLIERSIKKEFVYFGKFNPYDDQHNYYSTFLQNIYPERHTKNENFPKSLRAVFAYLMYLNLKVKGGEFPDYCTERFWVGQLPFVIEVITSIIHYDTQILNPKIEVIDHLVIRNKLRASRQLQTQLGLYIQDEIPSELQIKVLSLVNEVLMGVYTEHDREDDFTIYQQGLPQEYDHSGDAKWAGPQIPYYLSEAVLKLTYKIFPDFVDKQETFLANYLERAHFINGFFFERITKLMLELLVNPFETIQQINLIKFSQFFGIMHQLVNDPTNEHIHLSKTNAETLIHHWSLFRKEDETIISQFAPILF